jgi:hypothetical protein
VSAYELGLFVHLLALFVAFGASTVVHVTMSKVRSAGRGGDALPWLALAHSFARVFPVALALLVASGAWMLRDAWSWSTGFVDAGLAGVVLLFVSGAVIEGGRARRLAAALAAHPSEPVPDRLVRDPLWWCASWGNTGVAVGVAFAMVAKPDAAGAFSSVAVGLCAGAVVGLLARGSRDPRDLRAAERAA